MVDYQKIKLIVLDVDGTLTDGGIYYDAQGNELKRFDVKDGLGIKVGIAAGLEFAIITGRVSPMVERRAGELGIRHLVQGAQKKHEMLHKLIVSNGIAADEVCYIGDDWNDMQCMEVVGVKMCPADAVPEIRRLCDYVAQSNGGHGAVRDCLEELLRKRSQWEAFCRKVYSCE